MAKHEILIDRILSASGIVGRQKRLEIADEMRSHIEEIVVEELAAGHDEKYIEREIALRFGQPVEIAHDFEAVYHSQRIAYSLMSYAILGVISVIAVATFVYSIQYGAAR